jgi:phosphohistidine phosphatase
MRLYLVQHGAAKSEAEDPQRRLTADGARTVEHMAEYLAGTNLRLERIEHSDKARARQTAQIMAAHLRPEEGIHKSSGLAPNDDTAPMHNRLETESKALMLVGHLPYLSRLMSQLLDVPEDRTMVAFQMGGVVHLVRDETREWRLSWILATELLPTRPERQSAA